MDKKKRYHPYNKGGFYNIPIAVNNNEDFSEIYHKLLDTENEAALKNIDYNKIRLKNRLEAHKLRMRENLTNQRNILEFSQPHLNVNVESATLQCDNNNNEIEKLVTSYTKEIEKLTNERDKYKNSCDNYSLNIYKSGKNIEENIRDTLDENDNFDDYFNTDKYIVNGVPNINRFNVEQKISLLRQLKLTDIYTAMGFYTSNQMSDAIHGYNTLKAMNSNMYNLSGSVADLPQIEIPKPSDDDNDESIKKLHKAIMNAAFERGHFISLRLDSFVHDMLYSKPIFLTILNRTCMIRAVNEHLLPELNRLKNIMYAQIQSPLINKMNQIQKHELLYFGLGISGFMEDIIDSISKDSTSSVLRTEYFMPSKYDLNNTVYINRHVQIKATGDLQKKNNNIPYTIDAYDQKDNLSVTYFESNAHPMKTYAQDLPIHLNKFKQCFGHTLFTPIDNVNANSLFDTRDTLIEGTIDYAHVPSKLEIFVHVALAMYYMNTYGDLSLFVDNFICDMKSFLPNASLKTPKKGRVLKNRIKSGNNFYNILIPAMVYLYKLIIDHAKKEDSFYKYTKNNTTPRRKFRISTEVEKITIQGAGILTGEVARDQGIKTKAYNPIPIDPSTGQRYLYIGGGYGVPGSTSIEDTQIQSYELDLPLPELFIKTLDAFIYYYPPARDNYIRKSKEISKMKKSLLKFGTDGGAGGSDIDAELRTQAEIDAILHFQQSTSPPSMDFTTNSPAVKDDIEERIKEKHAMLDFYKNESDIYSIYNRSLIGLLMNYDKIAIKSAKKLKRMRDMVNKSSSKIHPLQLYEQLSFVHNGKTDSEKSTSGVKSIRKILRSSNNLKVGDILKDKRLSEDEMNEMDSFHACLFDCEYVASFFSAEIGTISTIDVPDDNDKPIVAITQLMELLMKEGDRKGSVSFIDITEMRPGLIELVIFNNLQYLTPQNMINERNIFHKPETYRGEPAIKGYMDTLGNVLSRIQYMNDRLVTLKNKVTYIDATLGLAKPYKIETSDINNILTRYNSKKIETAKEQLLLSRFLTNDPLDIDTVKSPIIDVMNKCATEIIDVQIKIINVMIDNNNAEQSSSLLDSPFAQYMKMLPHLQYGSLGINLYQDPTKKIPNEREYGMAEQYQQSMRILENSHGLLSRPDNTLMLYKSLMSFPVMYCGFLARIKTANAPDIHKNNIRIPTNQKLTSSVQYTINKLMRD